jgi:hypothetical protein
MAASNMLYDDAVAVGQKLEAQKMKPRGTGLAISALHLGKECTSLGN